MEAMRFGTNWRSRPSTAPVVTNKKSPAGVDRAPSSSRTRVVLIIKTKHESYSNTRTV